MKIPLMEFRGLVGLAAAFTAKRDIVPILRHLVFREREILAGDGGSVGLRLTSSWDFGPGFTLHAERLTRLLAATEGVVEEISLTPSGTNGSHVRAVGGTFQADFASLAPKDFPFPSLPSGKTARKVGEGWSAALASARFSVSQDETKPALRGLHAAGAWIRSSDNYRITRVRQPESVEAFLPDNVLSRLGSECARIRGIAVESNAVMLYLPNGVAFGQRLAAEFPDVDTLFSRYGKTFAADKTLVEVGTEDSSPVAMALRRVLLFTEGDLLSRVRVTLTPGRVRLETQGGGTEHAVEEVEIPVRGRGLKSRVFEVNGKMFLEAWERCSRFFVAEDKSLPLYFQSADRSFEHLLMPLMS